MDWLGNVEPTIDDALSDPLILAVMASDGISPIDMRELFCGLARTVQAPSAENQCERDGGPVSDPGVATLSRRVVVAAGEPSNSPAATGGAPGACPSDHPVSLLRIVLRLLRSRYS
jgi:hypothetical protein